MGGKGKGKAPKDEASEGEDGAETTPLQRRRNRAKERTEIRRRGSVAMEGLPSSTPESAH